MSAFLAENHIRQSSTVWGRKNGGFTHQVDLFLEGKILHEHSLEAQRFQKSPYIFFIYQPPSSGLQAADKDFSMWRRGVVNAEGFGDQKKKLRSESVCSEYCEFLNKKWPLRVVRLKVLRLEPQHTKRTINGGCSLAR